ncbi:hypothetical protein [Gordonia terrae]|uniref:hypothetical protein n=2 Tax=Gordonia TaxID=2053 RepID=UPI0015DF62F9|nr:hypothetical protein [Gordonia terrae]
MTKASWSTTKVLGRDKWLAAHYELTGYWKLRGGETRPVRLPGTHVFIIAGTRISQTMDFWSMDEFVQQLEGDI